MSQQPFRRFKKSNGVRQSRVQLKRGFVRPFGMNRVPKRLPERFENVDSLATSLSSRRMDNAQQFGAKIRRLPRYRFKPDQEMNGHVVPPN